MRTAAVARLNQAMTERVRELKKQWKDVCREAEMSYEMMRSVRRGAREPSNASRARIEQALRWETGSFEAVLLGRSPKPLTNTVEPLEVDPYSDPVERELWSLTALPEDERRAYIALHRRMTAMTGDERQVYLDQLRARQRAAGA